MDSTSVTGFLILGIVVIIIERFVIEPIKEVVATDSRRWLASLISTAVLVLPMIAIRESAVRIALVFSRQFELDTSVEIDVYSNLYAFIALLWGAAWGIYIRPWVYKRLLNARTVLREP